MANTMIPVAERTLTPAQVDALDARRRRGQLLLVMGLQFTCISCLLLLFSGQDATYSPGWAHPLLYWNIFTATVACVCFIKGIQLRKGLNEFFSY